MQGVVPQALYGAGDALHHRPELLRTRQDGAVAYGEVIGVDGELAGESADSVAGQCLEFILAGIDMHGREEIHSAAQPLGDIFAVCYTSGYKDGVDVAASSTGASEPMDLAMW